MPSYLAPSETHGTQRRTSSKASLRQRKIERCGKTHWSTFCQVAKSKFEFSRRFITSWTARATVGNQREAATRLHFHHPTLACRRTTTVSGCLERDLLASLVCVPELCPGTPPRPPRVEPLVASPRLDWSRTVLPPRTSGYKAMILANIFLDVPDIVLRDSDMSKFTVGWTDVAGPS